MYLTTKNQTVFDAEGKILFLGLKDFNEKIVEGENCFICGLSPSEKEFNNEHIIPNWILRSYELHNEQINLSNDSGVRYGSYTVPCCVECNSELSRVYETPISKILAKPYAEVIKLFGSGSSSEMFELMFKWLCLIFIKTHLKDTSLRKNPDRRVKEEFIGDDFYWDEMHHIHCIARSHYTNARIDYKVYGTIFIFPTLLREEERENQFDYIDNEKGKGILLQLGEFTIIAILNDSCAGLSVYQDCFEKINGPLNSFQARQVFSDLLSINLSLVERPVFRSQFSDDNQYSVTATLPQKVSLDQERTNVLSGDLLAFYAEKLLDRELENRDQILREIANRKRNYLWDDNGEFINLSGSKAGQKFG